MPASNERSKSKMMSIAESFTIHGMSRIVSGSKKQKIFWILVLGTALGVVGFASHRFVENYLDFDIRTEIRIYDQEKIPLPDIAICDWQSLDLGDAVSRGYMSMRSTGKINESFIAFFDDDQAPDFESLQDRIARDVDYPDKCVRVNMSELHTKASLAMIASSDDAPNLKLHLYFMDQSEKSLWAKTNSRSSDLTAGVYEVSITDRTVINRLPKPYPSDCTNGETMDKIFPGNYTKAKCEDTFRFKHMLEDCGDVLPQWRQFLKPWHKRRNVSMSKVAFEICLFYGFFDTRYIAANKTYYKSPPYPCPKPCHEVTYKTQTFHLADDTVNKGSISVTLRYATNRVTVIHEVPEYTFDKLLSDIGGWLGLFVGMSLLSLVEVGEFFATAVSEYICKIKRRGVRHASKYKEGENCVVEIVLSEN